MTETPPKLRTRVPWLSIALVVVVMVFTIGNALINVVGAQRAASAREQRRDAEAAIIEARLARIEELLEQGDRCHPPTARELARALAFEGRSAVAYADDYERRCGGDDPIVRKWAIATMKLRLARIHKTNL